MLLMSYLIVILYKSLISLCFIGCIDYSGDGASLGVQTQSAQSSIYTAVNIVFKLLVFMTLA